MTTPTHSTGPHANPLCGAKTRDGDPCKNPAMDGVTRCRMHGGKTPRGVSAPGYIDGRRTRYGGVLAPKLAAIQAEREQDANRLDLSAHLGLLEALIVRSLEEMEAGGGGDTWKDLEGKFLAYDREAAKGRAANGGLMAQYIREIRDLVRQGSADYRARLELRETIDQYRKTAATEVRRHETAQTMMHADQVMALFAQVGDLLARNVSDKKELQAISLGITRLLGRGAPPL